MKYLIIANPVSGKGAGKKYIPKVIEKIESKNIDYILKETQFRFDAQKNIQLWLTDDITDIVVIGGDGTLNEVVNGLYPNLLPIRLVNAGTGNDMIRSLGTIPFDSLFTSHNFQIIDLFSVNNQIGINALGIGFDGEVVKAMEENQLPIRGLLAYLIFVIKNLFTFDPPLYEIETDNNTYKDNYFITCVGNGKAVGGGFYLTLYAEIDDGLLDVCLIKNVKPIARPFYMLKVIRKEHVKDKKTTMIKTKKITIKSPRIVRAQIDGQLIENDIFNIEILPGKLKIISSIL